MVGTLEWAFSTMHPMISNVGNVASLASLWCRLRYISGDAVLLSLEPRTKLIEYISLETPTHEIERRIKKKKKKE
jgi:hypothetical protein